MAMAILGSQNQIRPTFPSDPRFTWEGVYILSGLVMAAWFIGFVPAILHASAMLLLHRLTGTSLLWFAVTPVVGWAVTFVPMVLLAGSDPKTFTVGAHMSLVGSAAALGCLAIAWWRCIYPVRVKPN
ncbi:MAG: hypothetical protein EOP20_09415 [Hyphomicrobiales bacterium]|nr:MAG: hypothetical protein EOP20_09415 [Hyphomicrobiales bacterium]